MRVGQSGMKTRLIITKPFSRENEKKRSRVRGLLLKKKRIPLKNNGKCGDEEQIEIVPGSRPKP